MPNIDVQVAAGSIPRFLRPTLESFPKTTSYLVPDPRRADFWRTRLAQLGPGLKVGICWRSSLTKGERHRYYSQLDHWGAVFRIPGVQFINLQYGECREELDEAEKHFGISITNFTDIDLRNEIDESAALTAGMDVMICASTAVSEMGGALGVEQYLLPAYGRQWDHLGCTEKMPWHPSIRIFPQSSMGDWETQLASVAEVLKERVTGKRSPNEFVALRSGVQIAVDGSLDDVRTYVLKEQGGWFDPEYEFVINMALRKLHTVDVGAGVGAYSMSIAHAAKGNKICAITPSAADAHLLMKSRVQNQLEKEVSIAVTDNDWTLDLEMDRHGLDDIAFVRVSRDMCQQNLFAGGSRFFSINSPLIMFGITAGEHFPLAVVEWLQARGYGMYRLIPGLDLLIPCASTTELDIYALNLFACKADRAQMLEQQGVLVRQLTDLTKVPGVECTAWQDYLRPRPYAADKLDGWLSTDRRDDGREIYWMALNLFAMSKDHGLPAAERYALLHTANGLLTSLVQEKASIPRLLSLCRVLSEFGKREAAVSLLNQICAFLHDGVQLSLHEPYLALNDAYASKSTGDKTADWLMTMVIEQREYLRAFSSFFTGQEGLSTLLEIQASGYGSDAADKRISLIKDRFSVL